MSKKKFKVSVKIKQIYHREIIVDAEDFNEASAIVENKMNEGEISVEDRHSVDWDHEIIDTEALFDASEEIPNQLGYKVGHLVMVQDKHQRWIGPYPVTRVTPNSQYIQVEVPAFGFKDARLPFPKEMIRYMNDYEQRDYEFAENAKECGRVGYKGHCQLCEGPMDQEESIYCLECHEFRKQKDAAITQQRKNSIPLHTDEYGCTWPDGFIGKVLDLFESDAPMFMQPFTDVDGTKVEGYYLHAAGDPSTGILDMDITPVFESQDSLEQWCMRNYEQYAKEAEEMDIGMWPGHFWWHNSDNMTFSEARKFTYDYPKPEKFAIIKKYGSLKAWQDALMSGDCDPSEATIPDFEIGAADLADIPDPKDIPLGIMVDDHDFFWKQKGQCPVCKDGTEPISVPGGGFKCEKCEWVA